MVSRNFASVKLTAGFVDEARREAETLHRSVGGQIEHWARLGRALESAPGFSVAQVRETLEGRLPLENLGVAEQDAVFDHLSALFDPPAAQLRRQYAELGQQSGAVGDDEDGRLVRRGADGGAEEIG